LASSDFVLVFILDMFISDVLYVHKTIEKHENVLRTIRPAL